MFEERREKREERREKRKERREKRKEKREKDTGCCGVAHLLPKCVGNCLRSCNEVSVRTVGVHAAGCHPLADPLGSVPAACADLVPTEVDKIVR
jgi:hypothetical protein